ncbi:unnamed protein product [Rotaria magnacalcarata]|uniref:Uncharacterized protein n=2 Tax=Rotaria magnacalcarata TaxID=392030 RepID=A0A816RUY3_9BILA|nr:unnamed protein product [Rotaria magnacalcarata]
MDESFFKISFPSDSGLCETNDFVHSSIFPSLYSSLVNEKISNINNELENNCFFPDDYKCSKLSTMIRWQSNAENLNVNSNSSNQEIPIAESYLPDDFFIKKTVPSASVLDDLISPMSRLSTSSSVMSFNSLGNYKVPQQLPVICSFETNFFFIPDILAELLLVLRKFGKCNIKWPKNDGNNHNTPGFCHVVYRDARSIGELLKHCTRQQRATVDYFLHIHMLPSSILTDFSVRTTRFKPIQVVPWNMKDNVYAVQQKNVRHHEPSYADWSRTIFVSPLHGKMTAFSLGSIMSNVFGAVSITQINTDKYGYPTGTGTVLFYDSHSYMRAVAAGTIDIKCDCFHKLLDIDPFLRENEPCTFCPSTAVAFCRNFLCLRSYCKQCWAQKHGPKPLAGHQPVTRREQIF